MTRLTFYIFLILLTNYSFADGPPIDSTGKVFCDYISIRLDSNQIKHLQTNRWLELTSSQQKRLSFLNLPKYIDILDPYHRDCTCGQIYAMWFTVDSIAFCTADTNKITQYDKADEEYKWYNSNKNLEKLNPNHLFITAEGQLNYMGQIVDINNIREKLITIKIKKTDKIRYITVFQPPLKHNKSKDKVASTKSKLIKSIPADLSVFWL